MKSLDQASAAKRKRVALRSTSSSDVHANSYEAINAVIQAIKDQFDQEDLKNLQTWTNA